MGWGDGDGTAVWLGGGGVPDDGVPCTVSPPDNVECLPFPDHLKDYIPNKWGSLVSTGQELFGMLEQSIFVKGCVLLSTRGLLDEELFLDKPNATDGMLPPAKTSTGDKR